MDVVFGWILIFFVLFFFIGVPTYCICNKREGGEPLLPLK